jgi:hypothetical protein
MSRRKEQRTSPRKRPSTCRAAQEQLDCSHSNAFLSKTKNNHRAQNTTIIPRLSHCGSRQSFQHNFCAAQKGPDFVALEPVPARHAPDPVQCVITQKQHQINIFPTCLRRACRAWWRGRRCGVPLAASAPLTRTASSRSRAPRAATLLLPRRT